MAVAAAAATAVVGASAVAGAASSAASVAGNFVGGATAGAASRMASGAWNAVAGDGGGPAQPAQPGPSRLERAYDAASGVGTFLFGEAKTDADRIRESQRELQHDARHFDRQRQMAERAAAAKERTVKAMIDQGQTGVALRQAIREQRRNARNATRADAVSTRLENSAAAVGDTEAKLRIMGAAAAQADALVRTNGMLAAQGSPMALARTIGIETERANMQVEMVEDALVGAADDKDTEENDELEAAYQAAVEAALLNVKHSSPSSAEPALRAPAAARAGPALSADDEVLAQRLARLRNHEE